MFSIFYHPYWPPSRTNIRVCICPSRHCCARAVARSARRIAFGASQADHAKIRLFSSNRIDMSLPIQLCNPLYRILRAAVCFHSFCAFDSRLLYLLCRSNNCVTCALLSTRVSQTLQARRNWKLLHMRSINMWNLSSIAHGFGDVVAAWI